MLSAFKRIRPTSHSTRSLLSLRMNSSAAATAAPADIVEDDVLFNVQNLSKVISLNRPSKLNSLNTSMVSKITPRLVEYSKSEVSNLVILNSTSPKAFCAGGDVAAAATMIKESKANLAVDFFQREYSLNYLISTFPKPIVAYMDGITMGGGVGLAIHAPFRIATEKTVLAMPEMAIGFFPDVGTTFFLPKLDYNLGYYFALTGETIKGLDNLMIGTATHYISSSKLEHLTTRISNLTPSKNMREFYITLNQAIEEFTEPISKSYKYPFTNEQLTLIEKAFSQTTVEEIFSVLANDGSKFAQETLANLKSKSLVSLNLALTMLNKNSKSNIHEALKSELSLAKHMMLNPETNDFVEGVSTKLITKTNDPKWKANTFAEVDSSSIHDMTSFDKDAVIDKFFDITYNDYPYSMGLPSTLEIKNYIIGNDGSNRKYAPTSREVVNKFVQSTQNKVGVRLKVEQVLSHKTENSQYDAQYIEWVD